MQQHVPDDLLSGQRTAMWDVFVCVCVRVCVCVCVFVCVCVCGEQPGSVVMPGSWAPNPQVVSSIPTWALLL